MTKLILLVTLLFSISLYATSTKRICGIDGQNYNSYEEIAPEDRAHMGYCGTHSQPEGQTCVMSVENECTDGLNCVSEDYHPCANTQCSNDEVCVDGECRDASLRCDYCKPGQLCLGGLCRTDCNLICNGGTCIDNECHKLTGLCVAENNDSDNGNGNNKVPDCSYSSTTNPMIFLFPILLLAVITIRRKKRNLK